MADQADDVKEEATGTAVLLWPGVELS